VGDTNAPAATEPRLEQPATDDSDARLLRALADLDNVRKRYERRLATAAEEERRRVLSLWLPIVDDLERALHHAEGDAEQVVQGVHSVYEHALSVLARLGFERFEDVGEQFDPERHEAVGTVDSDAPPGTIVATAQPGYTSNDSTARPARVVVARTTDSRKPEARTHD
jgi:molecular chaperone GrpE